MAEANTPVDVRRQIQQRLESLRNAGIEFLPRSTVSFAALPQPETPAPVAVPSAPTQSHTVESANTPSGASDQRRIELQTLAQVVAKCTRCPELASTRSKTVFGIGPIDAELCFVGEAPGADEDRQGEPFVGAAGQMLTKIINAMGFKREEVFICNVLRCRPPGNRTPKPEEARNCWEYLEKTIDLVNPKFICTLGIPAAHTLLGLTQPMGKMRGRFYEFRGIPVICTYHPSWLVRSPTPENKKLVWDDMKMLLARMGRPVPEVKKGAG